MCFAASLAAFFAPPAAASATVFAPLAMAAVVSPIIAFVLSPKASASPAKLVILTASRYSAASTPGGGSSRRCLSKRVDCLFNETRVMPPEITPPATGITFVTPFAKESLVIFTPDELEGLLHHRVPNGLRQRLVRDLLLDRRTGNLLGEVRKREGSAAHAHHHAEEDREMSDGLIVSRFEVAEEVLPTVEV